MTVSPGNRTPAPALRQLSEWAVNFKMADLPIRHLETVRAIVLDVLWGAVAGRGDARSLAAFATVVPVPHRSVIPGTQITTLPELAAFHTALSAATTDCADTHRPTASHPGIVLVPALLSALQNTDRTGEDLLCGLVVGYEIMARTGAALVVPGFADIYRTTAVTAPVAAAMAVARALGMNAFALSCAGSLAANTASGLNQWIWAGSGEHVFHAATAARNSIVAAHLAGAGMAATDTILDGSAGLLAAHGGLDRAHLLTSGLGDDWALADAVFKPAPACYYAQSPIQVATVLRETLSHDAAGAARIWIRISRDAAEFPRCARHGSPVTRQDAVMSIRFGVALALLGRPMTAEQWDRFDDPAVAVLIERMKITCDETLDAGHGAEINLHFATGDPRTHRAPTFVSPGFDDIAQRFTLGVTPTLGADAASRIVELVRSMGVGTSVHQLASYLAPSIPNSQAGTHPAVA